MITDGHESLNGLISQKWQCNVVVKLRDKLIINYRTNNAARCSECCLTKSGYDHYEHLNFKQSIWTENLSELTRQFSRQADMVACCSRLT
jgi:hypothetical protein